MVEQLRNGLLASVAAAILSVGASTLAQAQAGAPQQTVAPQQYVVTYGELAPNAEAQRLGKLLLDELTRLARSQFRARYFTVNKEIERPNFFTLIEVWPDAESYAAFIGATNTKQVLSYLQPLLLAPLDERDGNLVTP